MKIRNGFVSNSSSSSFIVSFTKQPKSRKDVREMLFNKNEEYYYAPFGDKSWRIEEVAETIWSAILEQSKNNYDAILEELRCVSSNDDPDAPNYEDYYHIKDLRERYYIIEQEQERYAKKKIRELLDTRKNKLKKIKGDEDYQDNAVYVFEFSDNDGKYNAALEHGNLFKKLKHIRISKH